VDAQTFDRFVVTVAKHPNRRAALRLLAGGLLGAVLTRGGVASTLAQRPDGDGDGLYDDDETDVYGTDPNNPDSDGDGIDDGQEVYDGTDPLTPNGGGAPPQGGDAPPPADGGVDCSVDPERCGILQGPPSGDILTDVTCAAGLNSCPGSGCVNLQQDPANCGFCQYDCGDRNYHFCYLGNCVDYCEYPTRRCTGEIFCRPNSEPCPA
jgi:hypothetical protein